MPPPRSSRQTSHHGCLCRVSLGLLALTAFACADDKNEPAECPAFEPMDPVTLDVSVRVITTSEHLVRGGTSIDLSLIADESGVYWNDYRGGVFVQRRGQAEVVTLRAGDYDADYLDVARVLGMAADDERIYIGEAYLDGGKTIFLYEEFDPPSRLLSIPKQGGAPTVLLEDQERAFWPVTVDGGRLIIRDTLSLAPWHQVDLASSAITGLPVPAPFEAVLSGAELYWGQASVLRAGFDDTEPEIVTRLANGRFAALGPGYVLSVADFSSNAAFVRTLFLQEDGMSCARMVPRTALSLGNVTAQDRQYFYYTDSSDALASDVTNFVRGDVQNWAPARLRMPGITMVYDAAIIGQDSEYLYVHNGEALLAVRKP